MDSSLFPRWAIYVLTISTVAFVLLIIGIFWLSRQTPQSSKTPSVPKPSDDFDYVFAQNGQIYGAKWDNNGNERQLITVGDAPLKFNPGANQQLLLSPSKRFILFSDLDSNEVIIVDRSLQQVRREKAADKAHYFLSTNTDRVVFRLDSKLIRLNLVTLDREELNLSSNSSSLISVSPKLDYVAMLAPGTRSLEIAQLSYKKTFLFSIASESAQFSAIQDDGTLFYPVSNTINTLSPSSSTSAALSVTLQGNTARVAVSPNQEKLAILWFKTSPILIYSLSLYDRKTQTGVDLGIIEELTGRKEALRIPTSIFFIDNSHLFISSRSISRHSKYFEGIYDLQAKQYRSSNSSRF